MRGGIREGIWNRKMILMEKLANSNKGYSSVNGNLVLINNTMVMKDVNSTGSWGKTYENCLYYLGKLST